MAGRRGFRCALSKRAYPGMFVAVGAVSNRATRMGMAGRRGFRCALSKRAYPGMFVAVGAVSNRATLARDRPSRYDKGEGYRSAGPCPRERSVV